MSMSERPPEPGQGGEPRLESVAAPASSFPSFTPEGLSMTPAGSPVHSVDLTSVSPVGRLAATVERLSREVRSAQAEAEGRALVELAKGILVERLKCRPAQAARQLAELAEQAQVTPLELAVDVINQAARHRMSEVTEAFLAATRAADEAQAESAAVRLRVAESGVLAADDTQAVADALLEQAMSPLGAVAVAIWAAGADGSLTLAGSAGFSPAEAARWRYVPPDVATVARRGLTERDGQWITSLGETGLPSIGLHHHPDGGRVALPAGTGGRIHGVLEIAWPAPLAPQPPQIVRQVEALAELCAHTLETHTPRLGGAQEPRVLPDAAELMDLADGLHDPALVLVPHLDGAGHLVDFRIQHVNSRFLDPAGRPRAVVGGALLLEAYPMAAGDSELFQSVERVYATGEPIRARRMNLTALVDQVPLSTVADISISRHGIAVLLIWRIEDETARLASLLQHAQRLGRIGGFEENVLTGEITWNGQLFDLYGRPRSSGPVPPGGADGPCAPGRRRLHPSLPAHADAPPAAGGRGLPAAAAGRGDPPHPDRRRTGARHRRPAGPRPRRLPGHLGAALDRGGARRHPRPAGAHRAAGHRTRPADPAVAARHHAARPGTVEGAGPPGGGPLPARGDRAAGGQRLVRRRRPAVPAGAAVCGGRGRPRHRGRDQHGRPAQRAARPGGDRRGRASCCRGSTSWRTI